jgi:hypothetical protein
VPCAISTTGSGIARNIVVEIPARCRAGRSIGNRRGRAPAARSAALPTARAPSQLREGLMQLTVRISRERFSAWRFDVLFRRTVRPHRKIGLHRTKERGRAILTRCMSGVDRRRGDVNAPSRLGWSVGRGISAPVFLGQPFRDEPVRPVARPDCSTPLTTSRNFSFSMSQVKRVSPGSMHALSRCGQVRSSAMDGEHRPATPHCPIRIEADRTADRQPALSTVRVATQRCQPASK